MRAAVSFVVTSEFFLHIMLLQHDVLFDRGSINGDRAGSF